jgi:hypothetical protein
MPPSLVDGILVCARSFFNNLCTIVLLCNRFLQQYPANPYRTQKSTLFECSWFLVMLDGQCQSGTGARSSQHRPEKITPHFNTSPQQCSWRIHSRYSIASPPDCLRPVAGIMPLRTLTDKDGRYWKSSDPVTGVLVYKLLWQEGTRRIYPQDIPFYRHSIVVVMTSGYCR